LCFVTKRKRVIRIADKEVDLGVYWLRDWLQPRCFAVEDLIGKVLDKWSVTPNQTEIVRDIGFGNALVKIAWNIVNTEIRYRYDTDLFNQADFWMQPCEVYTMRFGDCLTGDTEIVTLKDGQYEFTKIKDIKEGDLVLSYDFEKEEYCFKPVLKVMDKGVKSVYEISLKNGTWFRCTEEHKLFVYHCCSATYSGHFVDGKYWYVDIEPLSQFKQEWEEKKDHRRQLLCVKKIPSLGKYVNKDQLIIEGFYVAEGWNDKSGKVCIGSHKIDFVKKSLDRLGVSYREWTNNSGVPCVTIHKSALKKHLYELGRNARDKHFSPKSLSLSETCLKTLLQAYSEGDGYINPKRRAGDFGASNVKLIYNTSSDLLAKQLRFMHWILGEPLYSWYQVNHMGAGKYPIWRLYVGQKGSYTKEILNGVSKVPVKSIEYVGEERTYDITVADTHNFVLAESGLIIHNCEDSSILLASAILRLFEVVSDFQYSWWYRWFVRDAPNCQVWLGFYNMLGTLFGHAWVAYRNPKYSFSKDWLTLETTLETEVPMNLWIKWTKDTYIPVYMFNQYDSWRIDRDYAKLGLGKDYVEKYKPYVDAMINYVEVGVPTPQKWVHKTVRPVKPFFRKVVDRRWEGGEK